MTNMPNKPKTTGTRLALEKSPINKTAAITIKIIPTNSAIFWNIILHILISSRMLYRLSLERLSLCHNWQEMRENRRRLLLPHFSCVKILVGGLKFDPTN
jgi:hypothetical protein